MYWGYGFFLLLFVSLLWDWINGSSIPFIYQIFTLNINNLVMDPTRFLVYGTWYLSLLILGMLNGLAFTISKSRTSRTASMVGIAICIISFTWITIIALYDYYRQPWGYGHPSWANLSPGPFLADLAIVLLLCYFINRIVATSKKVVKPKRTVRLRYFMVAINVLLLLLIGGYYIVTKFS